MNLTRAVGSKSGEEVLGLETMGDVFEFLAVTREEDGTCAGAITYADDIALEIFLPVGYRSEGLVVAAGSVGEVGNGVFMEAWYC
jgi:hypothetical protein